MSKHDNTINDFISLFNAFWYRDFPLSEFYKKLGSRAEWTTHIGSCVKSCADLLGLFTYFESGGRTDAIIRDNTEQEIARIEWEWWEASSQKVNEIGKLFAEREKVKFSVFISYSDLEQHNANLASIETQWSNSSAPLLVFLVTFNREGANKRMFQNLETYGVKDKKLKLLRSQPALPWMAQGTRWESKK